MNGSGIGKVLKLFRIAEIGIASDPDKGGTVIFTSAANGGSLQNLRVGDMIMFDRDPSSSTKFVAAASVSLISESSKESAKSAGRSSPTSRRSPRDAAPAAPKNLMVVIGTDDSESESVNEKTDNVPSDGTRHRSPKVAKTKRSSKKKPS